MTAKHVFNVREHRSEERVEITAHVIPATSLNNPLYNVSLALGKDRVVVSGHCSCTGWWDAKCKHGSSVVEFVHSERHEGPTDELGTWHAPSSKGKALYPKGSASNILIMKWKLEGMSLQLWSFIARGVSFLAFHLGHIYQLKLEDLINLK